MISGGKLVIDTNVASLILKDKLDHSELDKSYFMKKLKNDSKLVD